MQFNVLLIGKSSKQTETYSQLIRDMVECHIDVMSQAENAMSWVARVRYHLIIIDLPKSVALVERIKRVHPECSVIVIADYPSIEEAVRVIKLGAEDYLKKPLHFDSFRQALRRGIDRKALFDEDGVYSKYLNLVNSCQMISASLEETRVLSILKNYLSRELRSSHACLFILDPKIGPLLHESDQTVDGMHEIFEIALKNIDFKSSLLGDEFYHFFDRTATLPSIFAFRFHCVGNQEYCLICLSPKKPDALGEFEGRLKILRAQVEVTGQNIVRYQDVQAMAYVDDVTGLNNTRYLSAVLDREIEKAQAMNTTFVVLFIDCDRFKSVNDQHGHLHGSKLLFQISQKLRSHVRETDTLVRYGGDEFVVILSDAHLDAGKSVAERIRQSVEKTSFLSDEDLDVKVTVSIGVAEFPQSASNKSDILETADRMMYEAKNHGRNQVFVAKVIPEPTFLEIEEKSSENKKRRASDRDPPKKKDGTHG